MRRKAAILLNIRDLLIGILKVEIMKMDLPEEVKMKMFYRSIKDLSYYDQNRN